MKVSREKAAIVGVGAVACAACCAGPVLGFLAAIGLGTAIGFATFGALALVLAAIAVAVVLRRRRHRTSTCTTCVAPRDSQEGVKCISTPPAEVPMS